MSGGQINKDETIAGMAARMNELKEKEKPGYIEKVVEVPHFSIGERIVEVPEVIVKEIIKQVPKVEIQYVDKKVAKKVVHFAMSDDVHDVQEFKSKPVRTFAEEYEAAFPGSIRQEAAEEEFRQ